jgi:hypothetical protein
LDGNQAQGQQQPSHPPPPPQHVTSQGRPNQTVNTTRPPPPFATGANAETQDSRSPRRAFGTCYHCGGVGHDYNICRSTNGQQKVPYVPVTTALNG